MQSLLLAGKGLPARMELREMWTLIETALHEEAMAPSWLSGIDRFHLTERVAEALSVLPIQKVEKERRLLRWRQELEEDDATIDRIERYLQRGGRSYFAQQEKKSEVLATPRTATGDARRPVRPPITAPRRRVPSSMYIPRRF